MLAAQGDTDTAGLLNLYYSETGSPPWTLSQTVPWVRTYNFGPVGELDTGFYRATEVGNGTTYEGESQPSIVIAGG